MDSSKGKSVTTSVPSIAIRFHANAEHLEELYASDDDNLEKSDKSSSSVPASSAAAGEPESSPLKYLPRLIKRSTSIDVSSAPLDSSPPSDPWKFFSDIRGKIKKGVEEKITEIKHRNQEDSSPSKTKPVKDSKDNSSLSDSESESSISRTCGFISTTEGVEMSSEDDTPSLDKDKDKDKEKNDRSKESIPENKDEQPGLRRRFRLLKNKKPSKEGILQKSALKRLYAISKDHVDEALPEHSDDVECAVEAFDTLTETSVDDGVLATGTTTVYQMRYLDAQEEEEDISSKLSDVIDNISLDSDKVMNVEIVDGKEVRKKVLQFSSSDATTVFAPTGFVDLRTEVQSPRDYKKLLYALGVILVYFCIFKISSFLAGLLTGFLLFAAYLYLTSICKMPHQRSYFSFMNESRIKDHGNRILEIPAVDEHKPLVKFEGWMNEFPEEYDPTTYHISLTQSVFLRLQGNLLRISNTRSKIPKRAMWNEPKLKPQLIHHRVYNLLGAKICLLPEGLNKKRHWSKKYPICITLSKHQMSFSKELLKTMKQEDKKDNENNADNNEKNEKNEKKKDKQKKQVQSVQFSKLTEEEDDEATTSRPSSPLTDFSESHTTQEDTKESEKETDQQDDDSIEEWGTFSADESPTETKIYLFGRTDREKEDWYRKLTAATHKGANQYYMDNAKNIDNFKNTSSTMSTILLQNIIQEGDFFKYMLQYNQVPVSRHASTANVKDSQKNNTKNDDTENTPESTSTDSTECSVDVLWMNTLIGRILYDCIHDPNFTLRVKERIQRKLAAIKLPYFIEELTITELNLGTTPPLIKSVKRPVLDERGLWFDVDISYEGLINFTCQTQLNLMKLKHPPKDRELKPQKSAMFNSDIDDSAESSSDEDVTSLMQQPAVLDSAGFPVTQGGSSNTSKRFIKMVDKIADSKFFQAATENRYVKRAMEGVSNTDLGLNVSVQSVSGTLVLNIPVPPSDRIWLSFRPVPQINLSAKPIVGERNITFLRVTSWIEQQLLKEVQKIFVIPNMEDIVIPVMCPDLPQ